MKVLFVVTAYPRHEGDVITPWMGETISRLLRAGTHVEVLAPAYRGRGATTVGGVRVHRFRYAPAPLETLTHDVPAVERIRRSPMYAALLPSYVAAGSRAARRIARDGNFDVVHVFWPIPHGIFGLRARSGSRAALVSTFFSAELMWQGAARKLVAPILRRIVAASDAVTVISSYTGHRLRGYVPDVTAVTIPFGAAAASRSPGGARTRRRREDPFELLFVGRLVRRKGVDVLLRAAQILARDSRLTVRVVGGGPEFDSLRRLSDELGVGARVKFDGVVPSNRIDELFRSSDALVLPAIVTESGDTEGLGVVLIEAMGYGKPVIASSAGGIVDIVKADETGLLVPPGDALSLANAIRRAMDQPDELEQIAERGAAFARRSFGWDTIVTKLSAVYEAAVERRVMDKSRLARKPGDADLYPR